MPKFLKLLLSLLAISLLTSFSYGAELSPTVKSIKGKAKLVQMDGKLSKLKEGQILQPGMAIETDGKAIVELALGENGASVQLEDNTVLKIVKLYSDQPASRALLVLGLELGSIHGHIGSSMEGSHFIVKTPEVDIKITGDEFAASAWGEIQAVKGTAQVTIGKDKVSITEGNQFDIGSKEIGPILAQK